MIEIETPAGLSYAQVTHHNDEFGYLLRILPGTYRTRPDIAALAVKPHRWVVFYPAEHAVRQRLVHPVGTFGIPLSARAFPLFRAGGLPDRTGHVDEWWLWDGRDEKRIGPLKDEHLDLPIREIVNHEVLVERLLSDWTPRADGTRHAGVAPATVQSASDAESQRHFVYFADENSARLASEGARAKGFTVEVVQRADEWLMSAETTSLDIPDARVQLEDIARSHGGKYDGWEARVPAKSAPRRRPN